MRLYFSDYDGGIHELDISGDRHALTVGQPRLLFQRPTEGLRNLMQDWPPGFDVSADGREFLVFDLSESAPRETFLTMVQNVAAVIQAKAGSRAVSPGE